MDSIKKRLLKYQFVENYFRKKNHIPLLSRGPKGKKIKVVSPHWDDIFIGAYGTLHPIWDRVTEKSNYDTIFLPVPWDDHRDHIKASKVPIKNNAEVWGYQVYDPIATNTVVNITETIRYKIRVLNYINKNTSDRDWLHYSMGRDAYSSRHLHLKGKNYAELFLVLPAKKYIKFREEYFSCFKD